MVSYAIIVPLAVLFLLFSFIHICAKCFLFIWRLSKTRLSLITLSITSTLILWGILFGLPYVKVFGFDGFIFMSYKREIVAFVNKGIININHLSLYPIAFKARVEWISLYVWIIPLWGFMLWLKKTFRQTNKTINPSVQSTVGLEKTEGEAVNNAFDGSDHLGVKIYKINDYVTLSDGTLEHRRITEKFMGRCLKPYEIVHHINGNPEDNSIENLCVMPRVKHEHFHSWLQWKKEKTGKYPSLKSQKNTLQKQYRGKLLTE